MSKLTPEALAAQMPGTQAQLAVRCGVTVKTVCLLLQAMVPAGTAHISAWTRCRGPTTATYSAGRGKTAPRPPMTRNAVNIKNYRLRKDYYK